MNTAVLLLAGAAYVSLVIRLVVALRIERRKYRDLSECFDESDAERLQLRAFVDRVVAYRHTSPDGAVHVLHPSEVEAVVLDFPARPAP